jgi:hypothetical protein
LFKEKNHFYWQNWTEQQHLNYDFINQIFMFKSPRIEIKHLNNKKEAKKEIKIYIKNEFLLIKVL